MIDIPRIVIAAPASGSGKTTVTCGLLAALAQEHVTQGFKVGPDYIDPGYHAAATGRVSRNLDTWMVERSHVQQGFAQAAQDAEIAVIEGVMGLFDGYDALSERGSTAEVAKLLHTPVLLVLDASKMARSAAAIALGFSAFDPGLTVAGVICNNVGSARHAELVTQAIESIGAMGANGVGDIPVLGCLPRTPELITPSRHLGLHTAHERREMLTEFMHAAATLARDHIDLDRLMAIARSAPPLAVAAAPQPQPNANTVRLAVARDEAFCFYYEDNFDLLRTAGAELVMFSPLHDDALPDDIAGIYLGGGYPELYSAQLAANASMLDSLRAAIDAEMPLYAECGGLMVLTERIVDATGASHAMLGVLPGHTVMADRVRLGYRSVTAVCDSILLQAGESVRGHEFHYSDWIKPDEASLDGKYSDGHDTAYDVSPRRGEAHWQTGIARGNLLASYVHLHFAGYPPLAARFVEHCRLWQITRQRAQASRQQRTNVEP